MAPRVDQATQVVGNLEAHPDLCIEYKRLIEHDSTVAAYHEILLKLERGPVLGEYHAAVRWRESEQFKAVHAGKQELAKRAFGQIGLA